MTGDENTCRMLVDCGLAFVLAGIIEETSEWDEECGGSTLGLSIDVVDNRGRPDYPPPHHTLYQADARRLNLEHRRCGSTSALNHILSSPLDRLKFPPPPIAVQDLWEKP